MPPCHGGDRGFDPRLVRQKYNMKKKALVTGGYGFIGSNLSKLLLIKDYEVFVIDDFSSGHKENLYNHNVSLIKEDLININKIKLPQKFDVVFHLAASVGRQKSIDFPIDDSKTNLMASIELLNFIKVNNIPKIIFSSSAAIYGELKSDVIDESHQLEPDSPYGVSKLAAEKMILAYSDIYKFEAVALRYFNIYGINQRFDLYGNVIPIFVHLINQGKAINIYGDGNQTRDFANVKDVALANLLAAETKGFTGYYNLGSGTAITINYLVDLLEKIYNKPIQRNYLPKRPGDVLHCKADISKIQSKLNFQPDNDFSKGLKEYVNWTKSLL
jgi:nucleoside-diphosphate-sugar epimerase